MSTQGLEVIDSTVQKTHEWIRAVAESTHLPEADAYKALRAVLQTLRDRLPVEAAVGFAAELPLLIRGIFYEGWRPSEAPKKLSREQFLGAVNERIVSRTVIDPIRITENVLAVVSAHIAPGGADKLKQLLPAEIRSLWPETVPTG